MITGLRQFLEELRRAGLRASTAEWIDALRAVERIGVEDRERFRCALRATLVKHPSQRELFDELFESFFASPRPRRRGRRRTAAAGSGGRTRREQPRDEPPSAPSGRRATKLGRELRALREGAVARRGRLRRILCDSRRPDAGDDPYRRRRGDARTTELRPRMPVAEERELARAVRRVVEQLRLRTGRRLRRTARGRPYLRGLFRASLRSGGVPFTLPHRRRRSDTPRVALLVDVSWSTARAAGLFLEIATEFLQLGRQTRVWLFVDRAVEATERLARWHEHARAPRLSTLLGSVPGLDRNAPSDYGRVFHQLATSPRRPRGRNTVLVVLGDGRTNVFDPLAWSFAELADACGAVLWLAPERVERWGTGDSALPLYLRHVDTAVEARDLQGLGRGVAELLRRV